MKKTPFFLLVCFVLVIYSFSSFKPGKIDAKTSGLSKSKLTQTPAQGDLVERGKYLVNAIGCQDCHSPKVMGPHGPKFDDSRAYSGHPSSNVLPPINKEATKGWMLFNQDLTAFVGPWGISYAANISSDATGIGNWTEKQFITAIRKGKYKGNENGRSLLPPMPWENFALLTDNDLRAILAYLKTTKPIKNVVPAPMPPDMASKATSPTKPK